MSETVGHIQLGISVLIWTVTNWANTKGLVNENNKYNKTFLIVVEQNANLVTSCSAN